MANKTEHSVSALACWIMSAVFALGIVHLIVSLRSVQIAGAADYSYASSRQSVRRVQTAGLRGRILDRKGGVLAGNRTSRSIVCRPSEFRKRTWEETTAAIGRGIDNVGKVIGKTSPLTPEVIARHVKTSLAMPLTVWRDIDERELAVFCEHEWNLQGFEVLESAERIYPHKSLAAHVIGYVGRDRGSSIAGDERFVYFTPEMRGRAGLEMYYDSFLRGVPGEKKVLVDARGFAIREWIAVKSSSGPDLVTTIDINIQRAVEKQLKGERGACVVIDPRNGEVLALASAPGFDLNSFVPILKPEVYDRYVKDRSKPLLNRAVGGAYAPGSIFKPITALAGLSAGSITPDKMYECNGLFFCGGMALRCASRWGHGMLDLSHALMKSCNPYFCSVGMDCGTNAICTASRKFALGSKTGIDLNFERAGLVPDGEWKMNTYGERWYPGDLAQMSIGQGMLLVTPIQMARVAGAIGTGKLVLPHLRVDASVQSEPISFDKKHLDAVRKGMRFVVAGDDESRGTGWRAAEGVPVPVSGKTGTAEVGVGENRRKNVWFIAYAPSHAPTAAVALIVENGQSGGSTAAPKVCEILKAIFGSVDT